MSHLDLRRGFVFLLTLGIVASAGCAPSKSSRRTGRTDATVEEEEEGSGGTPARGGASGQGGRGGAMGQGGLGMGGVGLGGAGMGGAGMGGAGMGGMTMRMDAGAGGAQGAGGAVVRMDAGSGGNSGTGGMVVRMDAGSGGSAPDAPNIADMAIAIDVAIDAPVTSNPDVTPGPVGLRGEYFAWNANPADFNDRRLERIDPNIDFNWGTNSPDNGVLVPADKFAVRWTGKITVTTTDTYTFYARSDDGIRLWINGALVAERWVDQAVNETQGSIALQAGVPADIRVEYYDNGADAEVRLAWTRNGDSNRVPVPSSVLSPSATLPADAGVDGPTSADGPPATTVGLVGYWAANEGSGTALLDSSGNGNNGALMDVVFINGLSGKGTALQLNGTNSWAGVVRSRSIDDITAGVTISAWVFRAAGGPSVWVSILSRQVGTTGNEHYGLFVDPTGRLVLAGENLAAVTHATVMPTDQWLHVAGTFDGNNSRLYVGGIQVGMGFHASAAINSAAETSKIIIGGNQNNASGDVQEFWKGNLDELRLYNRALSAQEISALAQ